MALERRKAGTGAWATVEDVEGIKGQTSERFDWTWEDVAAVEPVDTGGGFWGWQLPMEGLVTPAAGGLWGPGWVLVPVGGEWDTGWTLSIWQDDLMNSTSFGDPATNSNVPLDVAGGTVMIALGSFGAPGGYFAQFESNSTDDPPTQGSITIVASVYGP